MEDGNNRNRLSKLLRVRTTKSGGELVPLSDYVERMQEGQEGIYYVCGASMEEVQRSPYLERLQENGLEVVLFTEPMDEYMMQVRPLCCRLPPACAFAMLAAGRRLSVPIVSDCRRTQPVPLLCAREL